MITNHVYAVAGAKGGVGKTTTSINLGASLAAAGHATVVVELDLAMANLVDFLELDVDIAESTTLHDVLGGETDIRDAVYETAAGLPVVPSGTDLSGYVETDLDRLGDAIETLRWHHDVVILDTPAGLSEATVRPLQVADEALVVSTPRVSAIRNAGNTLELADRVDTDVAGLVLTKSGTGASPGAEQIASFLDVTLLGHVPEDDAVPHAQDHGRPVVEDAPNSTAAVAYRKIAARLAEADQPIDETQRATAGEQSQRAADERAAQSPDAVSQMHHQKRAQEVSSAADSRHTSVTRDPATSNRDHRAQRESGGHRTQRDPSKSASPASRDGDPDKGSPIQTDSADADSADSGGEDGGGSAETEETDESETVGDQLWSLLTW